MKTHAMSQRPLTSHPEKDGEIACFRFRPPRLRFTRVMPPAATVGITLTLLPTHIGGAGGIGEPAQGGGGAALGKACTRRL